MQIIEIKNTKSGHVTTIKLPSVTKEQAQAFVNRCNSEVGIAERKRVNIENLEYSLKN